MESDRRLLFLCVRHFVMIFVGGLDNVLVIVYCAKGCSQQ